MIIISIIIQFLKFALSTRMNERRWRRRRRNDHSRCEHWLISLMIDPRLMSAFCRMRKIPFHTWSATWMKTLGMNAIFFIKKVIGHRLKFLSGIKQKISKVWPKKYTKWNSCTIFFGTFFESNWDLYQPS